MVIDVKKDINVGVVGANGLVGYEMIKCLEELNDDRINIFTYASSISEGETIVTNKTKYKIEKLTEDSFKGLHFALFAENNKISEKYVKLAIQAGCIVIDNSSYFRMHKEVPLVCIGVNDEDVFLHQGIIASPSCCTIQLMRSLKILDDIFVVKKVIVSTYQSVSEIGKKAVEEYSMNQYINLPEYNSFPYYESPIHYSIKDNIIPQFEVFNLENGYSNEELNITNETKKILKEDINLSATCVIVPTYRGHGESVYIETEKEVDIEKFKEVIKKDNYVELKDDLEKQIYPLVKDCYYNKKAEIGRIRKDLFNTNAVHFFIVGDNLYLGAAYNTVMILKTLIDKTIIG